MHMERNPTGESALTINVIQQVGFRRSQVKMQKFWDWSKDGRRIMTSNAFAPLSSDAVGPTKYSLYEARTMADPNCEDNKTAYG